MAQSERKLAAIMFTDIAGYTALTQRDEALAMKLLEEHRALVRPFFPKHRGREVKTVGDAFLVEFDSALEAVRCAYDMQQSLHELNQGRSADRQALVRVGVHLGDVIHSQNDVYGDAVNVASRIEPLATPGGVCISEQVYDQVRNKLEFPMVSLGRKELKNVGEPVEVFKVVLPWEGQDAAVKGPDRNRVAVLPFANMSPDPNDEYFADGMTEELIDRLAQIKQLRVIARTSVMSYKGEKKKVSQIARELEVGSLVEGSVRKAGNRVRVTVQLVYGGTEEHLWSSHFDGSLDDIFAVQSEIAEKIAGELKVQLLASEKAAIERRPTGDTEAYTDYLQAMQLLYRLEEGPLKNALGLLQEAVGRDPTFAKAYAGMAACFVELANRSYIAAQEAIEKGREAAQKALELDPNLAEAHYGMAAIMYQADDVEGSMREVRKALELNPSLSVAYVQLSDESASLGDVREMVRAAEKAYQLDPLSPRAVEYLGWAYFYAGRGDEAMEHWKKTLHMEPYRTSRYMFDYYVNRRDFAKAEEAVREMERLGPTLMPTYLNRGSLAALTGDSKTAHEMIGKLDPGKGLGDVSAVGFVYYALGDIDRFFEYELRAADSHMLRAADFRLSPLFENARKDQRFGEVLRRAGLEK